MGENLSRLLDMNQLDAPLQNELARLRAWELGIELDPDSDLSPAEQLDRYLGTDDDAWVQSCESTCDADALEEEEKRAENELDELLRRLHDHYRNNQEHLGQTDYDINAAQGKRPVDMQVFQRLFRQTAAALHPDREQDDVRRREKHSLMSQLLKARKERDLVTLVLLHERYATADSALSSEDQEALEGVLVDYLADQRQRFEAIIRQSPLHHVVYIQFYNQQPATFTRRIDMHVRRITEKRQSLIDFITEVKTLKGLKEVLAARVRARRHSSICF
jgi:hypothetical protein